MALGSARGDGPGDGAAHAGSPHPWYADLRVLSAAVLFLILILAYSGRIVGTARPVAAAAFPTEVAFPVAFIAGVLALLSPCSGAILPAFFAYSFRSPGKILRQTYVFYLGLSLVFVPLGFASSLLAGVILVHADLIYTIGGVVLITLGVGTILGADMARLIHRVTGKDPSTIGQARIHSLKDETLRVLLLGAVFGFATSSCTAPIIGAMATLAIGTGASSLLAMVLFMTFALGIVTPLFLLAALFERYDLGRRGVLRGKVWKIPAGRSTLTLHSHHVITGTILIVLGIVFIVFRATLELTAFYETFGATEFYADLVDGVAAAFAGIPRAVGLLILLGGLAFAAWAIRRFARGPLDGRARD